jgi:mitogen-activated protein kinase 1/3
MPATVDASLLGVPYHYSEGPYDIRGVIGKGTYGTVFTAVHKPTGRPVAIKKMIPFGHPLLCLRALRELKLLKLFASTHENVRTPCIHVYLDPMTVPDRVHIGCFEAFIL